MKTILKKIIGCICTLTILMSAFPNLLTSNTVQAASTYYSEYGIYFDTSTGTITDADETITSLIIPDEIDGVAVTKIGSSAFSGCTKLSSVDLGDNIKTIGRAAFKNCTSLISIVFPSSLESITGADPYYNADENGAFSGCSNLETVIFNDCAATIGGHTFYGCSKIKNLSFGNKIKSIGQSAFYRCSGITTISIPDSVTNIGNNAFLSSNLMDIYIGSGTTSIGTDAIASSALMNINIAKENTSYKSINGVLFNKLGTTLIKYPPAISDTVYSVPEGVTAISSNAFVGAKNLVEIDLPSTLITINPYTFSSCTGLTEIVIPNSTTSIGNHAFQYCSTLHKVVFDNSLASIGSYAFYNCDALTTVFIPASVTSIGDNAFQGCDSLHTIYGYAGTAAETYANNNGITFVPLDEPDLGVDNYIIEQVAKYTSDDMLFMVDKILTSDYSDDVKFQVLNEIYHNYGLTDINEGVQYLSETSAHRMNYRFLTTDDIYGAYNFGKMLVKNPVARSALYTQGLIFNYEVFDYLDFATYDQKDYPGVKKNKQMLKDFMEQNDKEVDVLTNAKKTGDFLKKMVEVSDIETSDSMEELMDEIINCTSKERLESLQKQFAGYLVAIVGENKRLYFKSENFQKALGSATDIVSCVANNVNGLITLFNMEEQMALYEKYSYFLQSIYTNVDVSGEMRIAAKQLYDEIENGYYKQIKRMLLDCYDTAKEALNITSLDKMLDSATGGATTLLKLATFVSNIIIDTGDFTRQAAYTQGYAELSTLFRLKLEEDAANFKANRTAENAWKFFDDYNLLWSLRYKGEEQFLRMNSIKAFVFGKIKAYNYAAKKELVDDNLSRLNNCKFEFTEYEIPESRQYLSKSIMNCPVNVYVYTQEGELVAELLDGVESDVTNAYGRFAVVYRPYTGEYAKIICQSTEEKLIIKAEAVSDGLVTFETATVNDTNAYTFDNVNITKGNIIETEDTATYTIFRDENDEVGTQYTLNQIDRNTYVPVESITINNKTDITLNMGEKYVINTTVLPANASNKMITWLSDDERILTVENGVVTAWREGKTTIYAYAADGDEIVDSIEIAVAPANLNLTKDSVSVNSSIGQLIVAGYKDDVMQKLELINGYESELSGYENCTYIKAFLWDNMGNISSLCESKTLYLNSTQ